MHGSLTDSTQPFRPSRYNTAQHTIFPASSKVSMRIAFAGTPAFAAAALSALINAGHEVCLVLTQPDRPSGRGMKLKPRPAKKEPLPMAFPVLHPPPPPERGLRRKQKRPRLL